jgi:hypothetical protein
VASECPDKEWLTIRKSLQNQNLQVQQVQQSSAEDELNTVQQQSIFQNQCLGLHAVVQLEQASSMGKCSISHQQQQQQSEEQQQQQQQYQALQQQQQQQQQLQVQQQQQQQQQQQSEFQQQQQQQQQQQRLSSTEGASFRHQQDCVLQCTKRAREAESSEVQVSVPKKKVKKKPSGSKGKKRSERQHEPGQMG